MRRHTVSGFWQRSMVFARCKRSLLHQVSHLKNDINCAILLVVRVQNSPIASLRARRTDGNSASSAIIGTELLYLRSAPRVEYYSASLGARSHVKLHSLAR